jgi:large subunit ribosomal protein L3
MLFRMGLLGRKVGMTQIFEDGRRIPVTVLELGPNTVVQKKTPDSKDGYGAIQLGFADKEHRKLNKPMTGHFQRADVKPKWLLKELRVPDDAKLAEFGVQQELKVDVFKVGDFVDVQGTSKGKGFQGVMKKHNMKGSKQYTHGTHEYRRHGGSVGMRTTPGRINRGKRMCGQMGNETVTVQNLRVAKIDLEKNLLLVEGPVPGAKMGFVFVRQAGKKLGKAMQKKKTAA